MWDLMYILETEDGSLIAQLARTGRVIGTVDTPAPNTTLEQKLSAILAAEQTTLYQLTP